MLRQSAHIESNLAPEETVSWVSISEANKIKRLRSPGKRSEEIFLLKDNDVLSGRGSIINKHVGNRRFRRLITANKEGYARCVKNSHKFFLALSIVLALERKGGRFLKKCDEKIDGSCFIEISRKDSVAKVAQALRDQLQEGTPSRRRSSSSMVERVIEPKNQMKLDRVQREIDNQSGKSDVLSSEDDDDASTSDDTSVDSHEVLPIHKAAQPFSGFAELIAASSTMNPPPSAPTSFTPEQQSSLLRHFYQQSRGVRTEENHFSVGVDRSTYHAVASDVPAEGSREKIWVPRELETLMLSDPDAVEALATL